MAQNNNDWVTVMQSRSARIAMSVMGALFCSANVLDAAIGLLGGSLPTTLVEAIGVPAYYALTALRLVICLAAACYFVKDVYTSVKNSDSAHNNDHTDNDAE